MAVNPKDYLEYFESENVNKKHKGLEKGSKRMEFEHCAKRINSVREIESFGQLCPEKHTQHRFSLKNDSIVLDKIKKPSLCK